MNLLRINPRPSPVVAAVLFATAVGLSRRAEPASLEVDLPIMLIDKRRGGCPSALVRLFKDSGYDVITNSGALDGAALWETDIMVLAVGLYATPYTKEELKEIETFYQRGGSILILGQGWAFVHYGKGTEEQYPPNVLSGLTGIKVTQRYAGSPERLIDHAVTKGVERISYGQGVASTLELSGEARAIAFDKTGKVVMAASEGKGRTVHLGHVPYHGLGAHPTSDASRLLRNALGWLAPVARLTDEEIRSQLARMGNLAWLEEDPETPHIVWASLDGALMRINRANGEFETFREIFGEPAQVTSIAFKAGVVWVGTTKGLVTYDPARRCWSRHVINGDYDLIDAGVRRIERREKPDRLLVHVMTADGERTFTYNLERKLWGE